MKIQFDPNLEYQQDAIKSVDFERSYFSKMFLAVNGVSLQLNWSQGGNYGKN
jgi:hypothetical protein